MFQILHLRSCFDQAHYRLVGAFDGLGKLVNILRLDYSLQIILQNLGEIVWCLLAARTYQCMVIRTLQLGTTKVFQDLFPVWRIVISTKVRLQLATQDFQRGALANTVCSYQSEHLPWSRHGQSMQLETVCRVSMGDLSLQVCRQVDDVNGAERALFGANAAPNAETLRDVGNFRLGRDFDT